MTEHAVAILMWSGPIIRRIDEVPSQTTLDQIADDFTAENGGVRPTVRLLEHLTIPAYENVPEPVCEELQGSGVLDHGWPRHGIRAERQ